MFSLVEDESTEPPQGLLNVSFNPRVWIARRGEVDPDDEDQVNI